MPKVYIPKALEVVQLFAAQKSAINISLSAVGLLWNATDLLGRSRTAAIAAAAAAAASATSAAEPPAQPLQQTGSGVSSALGGIFSVLSLSRRQTVEEGAPKGAPGGSPARQGSAATAVPAAAAGGGSIISSGSVRGSSPVGGKSSGGAGADAAEGAESASGAAADPHLAGRSDLTEDECTELLIRVFEHLRAIGMDPRPEVRSLQKHSTGDSGLVQVDWGLNRSRGKVVGVQVSFENCVFDHNLSTRLEVCATALADFPDSGTMLALLLFDICRSATVACVRCSLQWEAKQGASRQLLGATACGRSYSRSYSMHTLWVT